MFLLLRYCFKKLHHKKKERSICILGLDSAGKSSLLNHIRYRFKVDTYVSSDEMIPTIGLNLSKVEYQNFHWTFWDVGGQETFREIWQSYFEDIDILIWVIDSSDRSRFEESEREFKKVINDPLLVYVPVAIIANKQDKPNAVKEEEISELLHLDELAERKTAVFLTSFGGDMEEHFGMNELLDWLAQTGQTDLAAKQRTEWRRSYKESHPTP